MQITLTKERHSMILDGLKVLIENRERWCLSVDAHKTFLNEIERIVFYDDIKIIK